MCIAMAMMLVLTGNAFALSLESQKNESGLKFAEMQLERNTAAAPRAQAAFQPVPMAELTAPAAAGNRLSRGNVPAPEAKKEKKHACSWKTGVLGTLGGIIGSVGGVFAGNAVSAAAGLVGSVAMSTCVLVAGGVIIAGAAAGTGIGIWLSKK